MEIGVPSRFACLNIEDEEFTVVSNAKPTKEPPTKKKVKKLPPTPEPTVKVSNNKKASEKTSISKKAEPKQNGAKQAATTAVSKKNKKKQTQQWEEWKQKDDELENGLYEEDLRNAILLSKLDFEHNKEAYSKLADESSKQDNNKKKNNNKKSKTISLDKFLNRDEGSKQTNNKNDHSNSLTNVIVEIKGDFFNSVDSETKTELKKEQVNAKRKKREANINEVISVAQYQEKYDIEHQLRLVAEDEVKTVNAALAEANIKIKTLCKMLGQGQMKDKAGILLENQQLTAVKNDLTETVASLHALLEKERSKVASLTAALNNSTSKQKEKKRKGH